MLRPASVATWRKSVVNVLINASCDSPAGSSGRILFASIAVDLVTCFSSLAQARQEESPGEQQHSRGWFGDGHSLQFLIEAGKRQSPLAGPLRRGVRQEKGSAGDGVVEGQDRREVPLPIAGEAVIERRTDRIV